MNDHSLTTGMFSNSALSRSSSIFQPESTSTLYQQALSLHQQNRIAEAETLYQKILDAEPNHPGATHFLGMVSFVRGNHAEATRLIEKSLRLCDTKAPYYNNYGVVLNEQKRYREAKNAFEKALILEPNYPDALSNLGLVSLLLKEPGHIAEHHLRSALRLQPNHRDALRHLVPLLLKTERHEEAIPLVERQIAEEPENAELHHQLACLYGECGIIDKSKRYFQIAASLPGGKSVWKWKHLWYCPTFFEDEQQIDEYWKNLNHDLDTALSEKPLYDWRTLVYDGFTHSFNLPHLNRCCKDVLEKFAKIFAPSFPFERPTYKPGKKIRVGFLVTPGHEGGFLRLTTGIIENLDPEKFEPVLIYNETTKERFEGRYKRPNLEKFAYSWNFEEAVRMIRDAQCDIIYYWKVAADNWSFFLPMCRLAPVQCTSWSTHGTSGVDQIDYYVSWDKAEIDDAQKHYTEKLFLLDSTPLYEPFLRDIPPTASRAELELPEKGAIYFCPHRPAKYHPMFDDYLKKILEKDMTGHVVLFLGSSQAVNEKFVRRMKKSIGETLFKRIIIKPHQTVRDYYRHLSVATVLLNSPIYSGEITSVDGFLYGVPNVSLAGALLFQCYSKAFHNGFGITDLAASSKEEYIEQAIRLGTDSEYRNTVSQKIFANHNRFFENEKTIHEWERFLKDATQEEHVEDQAAREVTLFFLQTAVPMGNLDINVSYGCNLNCQYCIHFCSKISGLVPLEEILETFRTWHRKVLPERLLFVGGEPLLHPNLEIILLEARYHWPNARLDLLTNGLLIPKKRHVLSLLKEMNGYVFISRHFTDEKYLRDFEESLRCLKESGVPFTINQSDRDWRKYYNMTPDGQPVPFDSDPEKAWRNCCTKNGCPSLMENRLYKCAHLAYATFGYHRKMIPDLWKVVESYQPLDANCDSRDIISHLASEDVAACRICPESYEHIPLAEKRSYHSSGAKPSLAAS